MNNERTDVRTYVELRKMLGDTNNKLNMLYDMQKHLLFMSNEHDLSGQMKSISSCPELYGMMSKTVDERRKATVKYIADMDAMWKKQDKSEPTTSKENPTVSANTAQMPTKEVNGE